MPDDDLFLPLDVFHQILTKVTLKSVVRFRCVCKTWYSLVSSPTFISDHAARTLNQSTGDRVLVDRQLTGIGTFTFRDKSLVESHEHPDVPEQLRRPGVYIVGSCNGLICLSQYDHRVIGSVDSFLIWNPSIRKLVELPLLCSAFSYSEEYLLGFGFDSESKDYKVMRVVYDNMYGDGLVWTKFDIFDLRKGVWRSSSSPMRSRYVFHTCESVSLYGNLHWIGYDEALGNYILVCFNLSTEVLHEMEVGPEAAKDDDYIESYAAVVPINGLLSLAVDKYMEQGGVRQCYVSVWSMKEYGVTESWTRLFNIELPSTMNLDSLQRFWENGEILLVERVVGNEGGSHALVLYNSESKKSKALLSGEEDFLGVCFYEESLVLL